MKLGSIFGAVGSACLGACAFAGCSPDSREPVAQSRSSITNGAADGSDEAVVAIVAASGMPACAAPSSHPRWF